MVGLARSPGAGWHVELVSLVTPGQIEITAAVVTYTDDRPPWIWFPFRDGDPKAAAGLNDREALIAGEHTVAVVDVVARKELRSRRIRTRNKNILIARGGQRAYLWGQGIEAIDCNTLDIVADLDDAVRDRWQSRLVGSAEASRHPPHARRKLQVTGLAETDDGRLVLGMESTPSNPGVSEPPIRESCLLLAHPNTWAATQHPIERGILPEAPRGDGWLSPSGKWLARLDRRSIPFEPCAPPGASEKLLLGWRTGTPSGHPDLLRDGAGRWGLSIELWRPGGIRPRLWSVARYLSAHDLPGGWVLKTKPGVDDPFWQKNVATNPIEMERGPTPETNESYKSARRIYERMCDDQRAVIEFIAKNADRQSVLMEQLRDKAGVDPPIRQAIATVWGRFLAIVKDVAWEPDETGLWVLFGDGAIRRLGVDGIVSPLIRVPRLEERRPEALRVDQRGRVVITTARGARAVVDPLEWRSDRSPVVIGADRDGFIDRDDLYKPGRGTEIDRAIVELGFRRMQHIVPLTSLSPPDVVAALERLSADVSEKLTAIVHKDRLAPVFEVDRLLLSEEQFGERVVEIGSPAVPTLRRLVETYLRVAPDLRLEYGDMIYGVDNGTPALVHLAGALGRIDVGSLDLVLNYYEALDHEHESYFLPKLAPRIIVAHPPATPAVIHFTARLMRDEVLWYARLWSTNGHGAALIASGSLPGLVASVIDQGVIGLRAWLEGDAAGAREQLAFMKKLRAERAAAGEPVPSPDAVEKEDGGHMARLDVDGRFLLRLAEHYTLRRDMLLRTFREKDEASAEWRYEVAKQIVARLQSLAPRPT